MNAVANQITKLGFTSRLPAEDYHALPAVSISRLKELQRSALHYRHRLENPKETDALQLGKAAHCAVLEPERFAREFAFWNRRSEKSGNLCPRSGQYWDAFCAENAGKEIITEDEAALAQEIARAVRSDPLAMRYLESGEPEVSMHWQLEVPMDDGTLRMVDCRGRPDWLTRIDGEHYLIGLKTSRDCRPFIFGSAAAKLGYTLQWAFYEGGYQILTGVKPKLKEIVVESTAPHDVVVYDIPEDVVMQGRADYESLLRRLVECEARNEWFGVGNGVEQILTLPTWAFDAAEDDISELGLEE